MAPLALEHICEEISTSVKKERDFKDIKQDQAFSLGTASFFAGGSAGLAIHVHNQKFLPKCFATKLGLIPAIMALGSSLLVYRNTTNTDLTFENTALHWHRLPYRKVVSSVAESG